MSILEMTREEVVTFLLKSKSYSNFNLPPYFKFNNLLKKIRNKFGNRQLNNFLDSRTTPNGKQKLIYPSEFDNVNYRFLVNKDGNYSWRPFEIQHPVLYVALVLEITKEDNWNLIKERFDIFKEDTRIECESIPLESDKEEDNDTKASILRWWNKIEQRSIELALDYDYVVHTDITDCYGSIYTHSIPWSLHGKDVAKELENRNNSSLVGNYIDKTIQGMRYGQTNGIPQGSILMDFIAEMILGYVDINLLERIDHISNFKIIRYRDDYRVFTKSKNDADFIMKCLTEELIDVGMKLGSQKTFVSEDLIRSALKLDKINWNGKKQYEKSLQKHLLIINEFSHSHPNSGSLVKGLNNFLKRLGKFNFEFNDALAMISISVDIALRNPRSYDIVAAIVSNLISTFSREKKLEILEKIRIKFEKIPNTGHLEVWLQRISIKIDSEINFEEKLCQKVSNNSVEIWNSSWLNNDMKEIISSNSIIDQEEIEKADSIIPPKEVDPFNYY